ncbi:MAG: HD domain-containing protein [Desulfobacterales bacterium]|nr:HD domain-containing protein [Desulfobacterales bacterium]
MKPIVNLLFEAKMLKDIPRAGFSFLGAGNESIAAHSFATAFIGYVMSNMVADIDAQRLISMCLVHDLPEARIGDQNYVNKQYVKTDEAQAVHDATRNIAFGADLAGLIAEFNGQRTREAQFAHDADQLAFILDLKSVSDIGIKTPDKWLPVVVNRLKTDIGKQLARQIRQTEWDGWWRQDYYE